METEISKDKIVLTNDMKDLISQSIKVVLLKEHDSPTKQDIHSYDSRLNFACPYCGDSSMDKNKKRGNLYWDTLYYKCYNDGCQKYTSVIDFLKNFDENIDDLKRFKLLRYIKENHVEIAHAKSLDFEKFEILNSLGLTLDQFYKAYWARPINKHMYRVYPYLRSRLLINRLHYFAWDPKRLRLFILNLNHRRDKVLGLQISYLGSNPKYKTAKYITHDIEKMRENAGLETETPYKEDIKKLSMIFNILNVDFSRTFTVFEGAIDSMFMKNSIAILGLKKEPYNFDDLPTVRYFLDNDSGGRNKMIKKLKIRKEVFLWEKFVKDYRLQRRNKKKDLNDLVIIAFKEKNNMLNKLETYFSADPHDIIYM